MAVVPAGSAPSWSPGFTGVGQWPQSAAVPMVPAAVLEGVTHESKYMTAASGASLLVQRWLPATAPRFVVLMLHGIHSHTAYTWYNMEFTYPTSIVDSLVAAGGACYAWDFSSHGFSSSSAKYKGKRCLFKVEDIVAEAVMVGNHACSHHEGLPLFLLGSSFGGLVSIQSSVRLATSTPLRGMVLLCPLVAPDPDSVPHPVMVKLLQCVACVAPGKSVVPMAPSPSEELNTRYMADPHCYTGEKDGLSYLRAGVCMELKDGLEATEALLSRVTTPFAVFQGTADSLSDPVGANALMTVTATGDRTLFRMVGMHHNMLLEHGHNIVQARLVEWVLARVPGPVHPPATSTVDVAVDPVAETSGVGMAAMAKLAMLAARVRKKSKWSRMVGCQL